jgi:hypothetical protein
MFGALFRGTTREKYHRAEAKSNRSGRIPVFVTEQYYNCRSDSLGLNPAGSVSAMPVTYTIDAGLGMIHTVCSGNVTLDEVLGHFRELAEDPACPKHLDVLLDLSRNMSLPQSSQLMAVTVALQRIGQRVEFGFCAIIAERPALYGMLRMFEVLAQPYFREVRVFRAATEAEQWLATARLSKP